MRHHSQSVVAPAVDSQPSDVAAVLDEGRAHERAGRLSEAASEFQRAVHLAEATGPSGVLSEAFRSLAVVHHRCQQEDIAQALCRRAHDIARSVDDAVRTAEALNTSGSFALARGDLDDAVHDYEAALTLATTAPTVRARIRQNLGIVATIRGDFTTALTHYVVSLEAYRDAGDRNGCVIAYHNLGIISAHRGLLADSARYFEQALELALATENRLYQALCLIDYSELFIARKEFDKAKRNVEESLHILDAIGATRYKADAYRVLGVIYRETNCPVIAEARLLDAIQLASGCGAALHEAEAYRELALLAQKVGRNQDALRALNTAHRLFQRVDARVDLVDVAGRVAGLESVFLAVVRDWGDSIEAADAYTHGHCERVAEYALGVADALGLDRTEQTTIRVGAYLHDLGKVRVPHEILNKPGPLTDEEFTIIKRHPIDGVTMLAGIDFPWNIVPMIRWHHEKYDGSGYPDGLRGDDIPLHAQIICIADVFDALTSTRSYRTALSHQDGIALLSEKRRWWRPDVFEAFIKASSHFKPADRAAAA